MRLSKIYAIIHGAFYQKALKDMRSLQKHLDLFHVDALAVGKILAQLGAGRLHPSDNISHGIGLEILAKKGQEVSKGETIAYLDVDQQQDVVKLFADVFEISPELINIHTDSRLIEVVK